MIFYRNVVIFLWYFRFSNSEGDRFFVVCFRFFRICRSGRKVFRLYMDLYSYGFLLGFIKADSVIILVLGDYVFFYFLMLYSDR